MPAPTALTRSQRRLMLRLNDDQRQAERLYVQSSIENIASFQLRYVIPFEDTVCYDTILDDAADYYFRQCPGSCEFWLGEKLILRALYDYGNADGNAIYLPSENKLQSHQSDFGAAASSSAAFEYADGVGYWCAGGRRLGKFDPATRKIHNAGFRFSVSGLTGSDWVVRDGDTPATLRTWASLAEATGLSFGLTIWSGLTQAEILAL